MFALVREELKHLDKLASMKLSASLRAGLVRVGYQLSGADAGTGNDLDSIVRVDASKGGKHVVSPW